MYLMGLEPYKEFKDLDIIVINPTNRDYDKLNLIREVSPLYQHIPDSVKYKWEAKFQFTCKGVGVDVFVEKGIDFLWQAVMIGTSINFVRVNSLQNILKARRRLGREKDITSIFKFIQKIVNL